MGMFLHYQNISDCYTPNNLVCSFPVSETYSKLCPVKASKPYEHYNAKGELIGYFWHYGDTLNLEFNLDGEITVESDSIIFHNSGEFPTLSTVGKLNQRAYNIVDFRSWTCISVDSDNYIWEEDEVFEYDEESNKSIYVSAEQFLEDKFVELILYNFRLEPIYKEITKAGTSVIFGIDSELSKKLLKGVYYCSLAVFNDDMYKSVFTTHDCTFLVK